MCFDVFAIDFSSHNNSALSSKSEALLHMYIQNINESFWAQAAQLSIIYCIYILQGGKM